MIKVFLSEYRRTVNIWLVFGILGVAFSICFDSFGGMCREHFLPIFAAFPFAASFCYERKSKAIAYIVSREGKKRYCVAKYIVNAISGGMVIAIGTAVVLLLLSTMFPRPIRIWPMLCLGICSMTGLLYIIQWNMAW